MPLLGKKLPIEIAAGVNPINDSTGLDTIYYTNTDKVRFQNGKLRKMAGCVRVFFNNNQRIYGAARTVFSYADSTNVHRLLIGTSSGLYVYIGSNIENITPLTGSPILIPNSLSTVYVTDQSYSVNTTINSDIVTFNIPHFLSIGDSVKISGVSSTVGGIPASNLNGIFTVVAVPSNFAFQVETTVTATSTATGGGTGITMATQQIIITVADNGVSIGERIKIADSADVGGIPAASINIENIVTKIITINSFVVNTDTFATSAVTDGGGADVTLTLQIIPGNPNQIRGFGFGMGEFGVGYFGISQNSAVGIVRPAIWSIDTFGNNVILTPGTQGKIYIWDNDETIAPVALLNSPSEVNWVFESNGAVCALGINGAPDSFASSDIGNATIWTPGPNNLSYATSIPGATIFISRCKSRNINLLFTDSKVYTAEFLGPPFIWSFQELFSTDGLIGPRAQVQIEDAVFWMGYGDWFVFNGTTVNILPNNTIKRYVLDQLDYGQTDKIFARGNPAYNEVWWFYCLAGDSEPTRYVIYNYREQHWTIGTWDRTAASHPPSINVVPYMIDSNNFDTVTLGTNPISTVFYNLTTDPISATDSSSSIVILIPNHMLQIGDSIQISNANTTHGITGANINGTRVVTAITPTTITVTAGASATSTGTGGGSSITVGTQLINVATTLHLSNGFTVHLTNITAISGFTTSNLNGNFIIRYSSTTNFTFVANGGMSTGQNSGGGNEVFVNYEQTVRLFQHEVGTDDYDVVNCDVNNPRSCLAALNAFAETNYAQLGVGDNNMLIYSVIPDSLQQGNLQITVYTQLYPQTNATIIQKGPFTITPQTNKVDVMALGRQRKYRIASNEIGQDFLIGRWFEQITESTPR
jgi:hypothetical protein